MATVKNWQIGREMEYPFPESRPQRQFAAVFDLNKCIGCQTCTMACKTTWTVGNGQEYMQWNNVETKPYGAYPMGWDVRILDKLGPQPWQGQTYVGKTVFEAAPQGEKVLGYLPEELDWTHSNAGEDEAAQSLDRGAYETMPVHRHWFFYLPRICMHCTYPACLAACPRQAIYKRPEDGIVLVDQARCRGYRECVKACPYEKAFYNPVLRISQKCIGCYPAVEQGIQPRCVTTCIGKIRLMGFLSKPDEVRAERPLDFLVYVRKVALPLYPQLGLEGNVYYIPPVHVPREFLRQMFGPGTDQAIETYLKGKDDPELLGLLHLFGDTKEIVESFKAFPATGEAAGYDRKGREIVRVPFREPNYLRPFYDAARQVYRHNIS
ncbi:MAG: dehydrogenase [Deltaproteobacteria bacterium]|nr:dehydrogenase [Deltaproteobacteria bacterium]